MLDFVIKRVQEEHAELFHNCLDEVAKEKFFLLLLKAPPLERVREFLSNNVKTYLPQFFAFRNEMIVVWCDIRPISMSTLEHRAELGMGVRKAFRGQGIGRRAER